MTRYSSAHKINPLLHAMNIPDAKEVVDKTWKKLETTPARQLEKVKSKKEVIPKAQKDKKKVHFATLMDICHLKNTELEPTIQKYKGRVILRRDIAKDDSGACAVFAEQGSSASQMTAAEVMDVIARLPDCDGQAGDAVSAHTQVRLEDAPRLLRIPKVRMSRRMDMPSHTHGPNHGQTSKTQWCLLNAICTDTHTQDFHGRGSSKKLYCKWNRKKVPHWVCLFVRRKQGLFLSVYVDDIKMVGQKQNMAPMWKKLMKMLILTDQLHLLITFFFWGDAPNADVNRTKLSHKRTEKCSNHEFCWSN